ncbi:MAG: hypothetical protein KME30_32745 [Iphinoe sp. HA4291-MV1]|jgi:hypothetical protein|nr:hypothetical protein [Iphinoe sp. HA4291-MV1]
MLLNNAIAAQQSLYSQLQIQIDELQAKQREIQAYMQQLGSVESSMESAAQMLQQAIAEIRSVCPDELGAYQTIITSLFTDAPIAQLAAAADDDENPDPDNVRAASPEETPTPTPPTPSDNVNDDEAITTDVVVEFASAPQLFLDDEKSEVATTVILPTPPAPSDLPSPAQISHMKKADVQYWLAEVGESTDGKIGELRTRLIAYITQHQQDQAA